MNEETLEKKSFIDILKSKKKFFSILIVFLTFVLLFFVWIEFSKKNKKTKNSENFIQAKVLFSEGKEQESLKLLKTIIDKKDDVYSPLSLFLIIDQNLEKNEKNILNYFDTILSIGSLKNEDLNLIKLKKAIFISENSEEQSIINLLNPIINSESVWKMESLKFLGDYFFSLNQPKKAGEYYSLFLKEADDNLNTSEIKRKMKIIKDD